MTIESQEVDIPEPTPDEQLAATITDTLVKDGFLADSRRERFKTKLATGQLKAEDWRTHAAAAMQKSVSEGAE